MSILKSLSYYSIFALLFVAMIGWNCAGEGGSGTSAAKNSISGTIKNANNIQIFLDKVSLNNKREVLGKADADASGSFSIPMPENMTAGLYNLRVGAKRVFLPLNGEESGVAINADLNTINKYDFTVTGSKDASEYVSNMKAFFDRNKTKDQINAYVNSPESSPIAALHLATSLLSGEEKYLKTHEALSQRLASEFPNQDFVGDYGGFVNNLKTQIAQAKSAERIKIGQLAPDIKADDPDGKSYALSDLKGKVVLLDFWASWCGPCRRANPHVVETYKKYKKDGFTVFSVSLDGLDSRTKARFKNPEQIDQQMQNSKKRWVDAIKKDNLIWNYHVSDLKKWESIHAQTYGVRSIPRTFLIDRDGKIAVVNPRNNLESELKKLL